MASWAVIPFNIVSNVFAISSPVIVFPFVGNFPNILIFLASSPILFTNAISKFTSFPASEFDICTNCFSSFIPFIPATL